MLVPEYQDEIAATWFESAYIVRLQWCDALAQSEISQVTADTWYIAVLMHASEGIACPCITSMMVPADQDEIAATWFEIADIVRLKLCDLSSSVQTISGRS